MIDDKITPTPILKVERDDPRAMMYQAIADIHRKIVQAKWQAQSNGQPGFQLPANLPLHLEESVAFLAEEVLKLRTRFEETEEELLIDGTLEEKA